jgi:hypothetical protein
LRIVACLLGAALLLGGCANLATIDRTHDLPVGGSGRAIHLDAQQRLLIFKDDQFCAEPAPDALNAYASAAGLGVSVVGQGAGSATQAFQNAAASIGLRTQSITLMRDLLYRLCEAYNNGDMSEAQVAAAIARSQDLTAVVLAIEQLTGAVAAQQVVLSGNGSADASANLTANQQLLEQARDREAAAEEELTEAQAQLDTAKATEATALKDWQDAVQTRDAAADDAEANEGDGTGDGDGDGGDENADELAAPRQEANQKGERWEEAVDRRMRLERRVDRLAQRKKEATEVRQAIESAYNTALTNASAEASTSGQFTPVVQRNQLSDQATQAIAESVQNMVERVLSENYVIESCLAALTSPALQNHSEFDNITSNCMNLLKVAASSEARFLRSTRCDAALEAALDSGETSREALRAWMNENDLNEVSVTAFRTEEKYADRLCAFVDTL